MEEMILEGQIAAGGSSILTKQKYAPCRTNLHTITAAQKGVPSVCCTIFQIHLGIPKHLDVMPGVARSVSIVRLEFDSGRITDKVYWLISIPI